MIHCRCLLIQVFRHSVNTADMLHIKSEICSFIFAAALEKFFDIVMVIKCLKLLSPHGRMAEQQSTTPLNIQRLIYCFHFRDAKFV